MKFAKTLKTCSIRRTYITLLPTQPSPTPPPRKPQHMHHSRLRTPKPSMDIPRRKAQRRQERKWKRARNEKRLRLEFSFALPCIFFLSSVTVLYSIGAFPSCLFFFCILFSLSKSNSCPFPFFLLSHARHFIHAVKYVAFVILLVAQVITCVCR